MLPHISDDLSSSFIEKLEEMLQKCRGETVNFDSRKVRKFKGFEFPRPDGFKKRGYYSLLSARNHPLMDSSMMSRIDYATYHCAPSGVVKPTRHYRQEHSESNPTQPRVTHG